MQQLSSISSRLLQAEDALIPSEDIYTAKLTADTQSSLTVPAGATHALMNFRGGTVWVNYDTAATVPSSSTFSKSGGEPDPVFRYVGDITTINFISSSPATVSVAFYSK